MTETITASVMENPTRQCVCGGWTRFSVCQYCGTPDPSVAAETAMPVESALEPVAEPASHEFTADFAPDAVEAPYETDARHEVFGAVEFGGVEETPAAPFTPAHADPALFTPDYAADVETEPFVTEAFESPAFESPAVESPAFEGQAYETEPFVSEAPVAVETSLGYDVPGYDVPGYDVPAYDLPEHEVAPADDVDMASYPITGDDSAAFEMPAFEMPSFDPAATEVPHVVIPGYDEPEPEVATFDAPQAFDLPVYDTFTDAIPAFETPAFDVADYTATPYEVTEPGGLGYDEALGYDTPVAATTHVDVEAPSFEASLVEAVEPAAEPLPELPPMTYANADDLEDEFGDSDGLPDFGSLPLDDLLPAYEAVEFEPVEYEPADFDAMPYEPASLEELPFDAAPVEDPSFGWSDEAPSVSFDDGFPPVEAAYVAVPDQLEDTQIWEPDWALDLAVTTDEVPSTPHDELEVVPAIDVLSETDAVVDAMVEADAVVEQHEDPIVDEGPDDVVAVPEQPTVLTFEEPAVAEPAVVDPADPAAWHWQGEPATPVEHDGPAELTWPELSTEPTASVSDTATWLLPEPAAADTDLFTPSATEAEFVWPTEAPAAHEGAPAEGFVPEAVVPDPADSIESLPVHVAAPSLEIGPEGTTVASPVYEPVPDAAWGEVPAGSGWENASWVTESWSTEAGTEVTSDGEWFTPGTAAPVETDWSTPPATGSESDSAWASAEPTEVSATETAATDTGAELAPIDPAAPDAGDQPEAKRSHRTRTGLLAVALVGVVGVGGYSLLSGGSPAATPPATPTTPTVAHPAAAPPAVDLNRSPVWLHLAGASQAQAVTAIPAIEVANRSMAGVLSSTGISATTQAGTHFRATALHFATPAAAQAFAAATPPAPWKETVSGPTQRTALSTVGVVVTTIKGSDAIAVGADNPATAIQAQAWATILAG